MKTSRLLSSLLLFLGLLACTSTLVSAQFTPVSISTSTATLTAGTLNIVTPYASTPVTLALPPPTGLSIKVKNQSQQQVKVTGQIFNTQAATYLYVNPGSMVTLDADGTYWDCYLPQQLIDTYTQSLNGTSYTLTTTAAAVTGGTTNPVIQINNGDAGWYFVTANGIVYEAAFTIASPQNVQLLIYRTNNSTGAIPGSGTTVFLGAVTTVTASYQFFCPPVLVYLNNLDILTVYASIGNTGTAGSCTIPQATIQAFRWQ